jgi:hypothetical protein
MTANGRPSGEALVRFTNKEQRNLALKRNGMKFGARSIEVCISVVFVRWQSVRHYQIQNILLMIEPMSCLFGVNLKLNALALFKCQKSSTKTKIANCM